MSSVPSTLLTANVQTAVGVISLLNDFLISHNKAPLGELNPLLYHLSRQGNEAINDVTSGENPGCGTPGFKATTGWDPVRATRIFPTHFRRLANFVLCTRSRV